MNSKSSIGSEWAFLRIASSQLPIGGYSYSQGLEWIIESRQIRDSQTALDWLTDQALLNLSRFEGVLFLHLCRAIHEKNWNQGTVLAERLRASRETSELYSENQQMGYSLMELITKTHPLDSEMTGFLNQQKEIHFHLAWAVTACSWNMTPENSIKTWLWTWLENQITVIVKTLPLGQITAQKLINQLIPVLDKAFWNILATPLEKAGTLTFGFALNSMRHEHQYSRLFRS